MRIFALLLVSAVTAGAQTPPATYQAFAQSCEVVRPAAITLLQQRGFARTAAPTCTECVEAEARHLQDANGHRFWSNRKVIERYTNNSLEFEKSGLIVQKVHVGLTVQAHLHLLPTAGSCQADLRFAYSWYGAQMVLGVPVDGDPGHGDSNGKLEAAYLQALEQQLARATVAKR